MLRSSVYRSIALLILISELIVSLLPMSIVSAATPPTPAGFLTGGLFAQYFQNAVGNPCPALYYLRGFKSIPASDYMKPDCVLGQNIDKWDLSGNAGTTAVNFLGTTDAQPLKFKTNGVQNMILDTTGNLGIGTNAPGAKLDVEGRFRIGYNAPIYGAGITAVGPGGGGWSRLYGFTTQDGLSRLGGFGGLGTNNALSSLWIGKDHNDYVASFNPTTYETSFSGSVGIGTTTPTNPLEIKSAADNILRLTQPDPGDGWNYIEYNSNAGRRWWVGTDSNGVFNITRDGAAATMARIGNAGLTVDNTLAVGFSTASYPLDVNGSIRQVNGTILLDNTSAGSQGALFNYYHPGFADNGDVYLGAGRDANRAKNNITLYNLSCSPNVAGAAYTPGDCNVPIIQLYGDAVHTDGKFGIGGALPDAKLTINQSGNGWNDGIRLRQPFTGTGTWDILSDGGSAPGFFTIAPNQDYTKSFTIQASNGNVGIGTTTPTSKLDIMSSYSDASLNADAPATANFRTPGHVQLAISTQLAAPYTTSIQAKHTTANGSAYPIALNPLGGNIGIGTTTPTQKLEVNGLLRINNSNGDTTLGSQNGGWFHMITDRQGFYMNTLLAVNGEIRNYNGWRLTGNGGWGTDTLTVKTNAWDGTSNNQYGNIAAGHGYYYGGLQSGGPTGWEAAGGELYVSGKSMLMGNVGIGTNVPQAKLDVQGGAIGGSYALTPKYSSWANYGVGEGGAAIYNDNVSYKTLMLVGNDSAGGGRQVSIWDQLNVNGGASISTNLLVGGTTSSVGSMSAPTFYDRDDANYYINPNGGSILNTLRIAGGSPGIGKVLTSTDGAGNATWQAPATFTETDPKIGVNTTNYLSKWSGTALVTSSIFDDGNISIGTNLSVVGNVTAASFNYSSDRSLKKDIVPLEDSLQKLLTLNGYAFTWKKDGKKDIGVIAQEVEKVFPDLVHTDPSTGLKSVEYGNLIAPLIESVKLQQKTIDTQNKKIEGLENRLEKLEALLY